MQKRVLAVHDISCVGKCSLTVALPILSAAGIETSVLPTAVLSTHTGGFTGFTYRDLTDDIVPIVEHWKSLGLRFDAIYTGYLGSFRQLKLVEWLFDELADENTLILIDPVMGDGGRLYANFTEEFAKGMAALCRRAHIIIPNLTEAAFMLGRPYEDRGSDREYVYEILRELTKLGPWWTVLSGVSFAGGNLGAAAYDARTGRQDYYAARRVEGYYHGTGDIFGSSLLAALLRGMPMGKAIEIAVDFTEDSICRTHDAGTDVKYGVDFEESLPGFIRALGLV